MSRVNWPQAFAEVFLIVVGVGAALAADSWNNWRIERKEEQEYLQALRTDFEETQSNLEAAIAYNSSVRDSNLRLLSLLEQPRASVPPDTLAVYTNRAFRLMPFGVVMGTYNDMVNSGKLEIISSDSLRFALADLDVRRVELQAGFDQGIKQWNSLQVPFLISRANVIEQHGGEYRGLQYPEGPVASKIDAYWTDEFANLLAISVISKQDVLIYARTLGSRVERILRLIGEGLRTVTTPRRSGSTQEDTPRKQRGAGTDAA